jgi:TonB family protein
MFSERVFQITFLVSLVAHGVILYQNPGSISFPRNKKEPNLKISYIIKPAKAIETSQKFQTPKNKDPFLKLPPKINLERRIPPPFIEKEIVRPFSKPDFIKPDILAIKKKITLPPIDADKINNPSYISYYQIVREKIKRSAYQNYTGQEIGEITVSFVISNTGYLKDLRLIEEESSASRYLREIALRSVEDASNFPNFPKELDHSQLSFNLTITFEIE